MIYNKDLAKQSLDIVKAKVEKRHKEEEVLLDDLINNFLLMMDLREMDGDTVIKCISMFEDKKYNSNIRGLQLHVEREFKFGYEYEVKITPKKQVDKTDSLFGEIFGNGPSAYVLSNIIEAKKYVEKYKDEDINYVISKRVGTKTGLGLDEVLHEEVIEESK